MSLRRLPLVFGLLSMSMTAFVPSPAASAAPSTVRRISGADRYGTAVALSQSAFPSGAPTIIVASGEAFPDALAAGPAAVALGGPVLLTRSTSLPDVTATEIRRLAPATIYLAGGPAAVSEAVTTSLSAIAPVIRVAGIDRHRTASALAAIAFPSAVDSVWLSAGDDYSEALLGASAAATDRGALLLAPRGELPAEVMAELTRLHPARVVVVGIATPADVIRQVRTAGFNVRRLTGVGAFATGAVTALDHGRRANRAYLATVENFPDALAATAVAGREGAPIFFTQTGCVPETTRRAIDQFGVTELVLVGGIAALGPGVEQLASCGPEGLFIQTVAYRAVYSIEPGGSFDPAIPGAIRHELELVEAWFLAQTGGWRPRFDRDDNGQIIVTNVQLSSSDVNDVPETVGPRAGLPLGTAAVAYHAGRGDGAACGAFYTGDDALVLWMPVCDIFPSSSTTAFPYGATYLAAHELTHSLGAVSACAPHHDGSGHANDDARDVIYSGPNPRVWDALTLDPGHDDYYLHGRADCGDIADSARWEWIG